MTNKRVDIAIVGAGLIGSALALWLSQNTTFSVALIERNEAMNAPKEPNQRVVALGHLAIDFLSSIDVFDQLTEVQSHSYRWMRVWDENSNGELEFDSASLNRDKLGCMVDSLACNYALQQTLIKPPSTRTKSNAQAADCYFGVTLHSFNRVNGRGQLSATDRNGDALEVSAQLVVAADGGNSWVRQQAGIFANRHAYQQQGIVARIETEQSHQDCAWQRFLSTGPIAVLPLANNQSSIVWSANDTLATELLSLNQSKFEERLKYALQGRLGDVSLLSARAGFALSSQRCEVYYKRNVVLVGDAAHSIHPLAGQGANLGFKDALALGQLLAGLSHNSATSKCIGEPKYLARYQAKRQGDNRQMDALMSALHASYQFDWPLWMVARGAGMNLLNSSARIRELLAKQAMGI